MLLKATECEPHLKGLKEDENTKRTMEQHQGPLDRPRRKSERVDPIWKKLAKKMADD